jgi:hypothetical protein
VKICIVVFWVMMVCSLTEGYQCFEGTYCLHVPDRSESSKDVGRLHGRDQGRF